MNAYWHTKEGNPRLLVFFNGWGCNELIFSEIKVPGHDVLIFSDYTSLNEKPTPSLEGYKDIKLLAWSFGVFAAGASFSFLPAISRRIAINGTPWPIDNAKGIPEKIFALTLAGYNNAKNRTLFFQRVIGDSSSLDHIRGLQDRALDDQRRELEALSHMARPGAAQQEAQEITFPLWDKAIICESDKIFPPRNMKNAWGDKAVLEPGNHLPDFQHIVNHYILP